MKLSTPNVIAGDSKEVKKGATTSQVLLDVGGGVIIASITNQAVDELKLGLAKRRPQ